MPTYEYECKSCSHNFDVFQNMADEPLKTCPKCGKDLRRVINGGSGVIFKGSGFYVTDKKGGSKSASKETSKSEPSSGQTACAGCPAATPACPVSTEAS